MIAVATLSPIAITKRMTAAISQSRDISGSLKCFAPVTTATRPKSNVTIAPDVVTIAEAFASRTDLRFCSWSSSDLIYAAYTLSPPDVGVGTRFENGHTCNQCPGRVIIVSHWPKSLSYCEVNVAAACDVTPADS